MYLLIAGAVVIFGTKTLIHFGMLNDVTAMLLYIGISVAALAICMYQKVRKEKFLHDFAGLTVAAILFCLTTVNLYGGYADPIVLQAMVAASILHGIIAIIIGGKEISMFIRSPKAYSIAIGLMAVLVSLSVLVNNQYMLPLLKH
jgi:hypothetical protein